MCVLWWMVCKWIPGKTEKSKGRITDRVGVGQIDRVVGGGGASLFPLLFSLSLRSFEKTKKQKNGLKLKTVLL